MVDEGTEAKVDIIADADIGGVSEDCCHEHAAVLTNRSEDCRSGRDIRRILIPSVGKAWGKGWGICCYFTPTPRYSNAIHREVVSIRVGEIAKLLAFCLKSSSLITLSGSCPVTPHHVPPTAFVIWRYILTT